MTRPTTTTDGALPGPLAGPLPVAPAPAGHTLVRVSVTETDGGVARGPTRVFVRGKTRRGARFGPPEAAVDGPKRRRLLRGATAWLAACEGPRPRRVRFDVLAWQVSGWDERNPGHWRLRHIEGAFGAGD